MPPNQTIRYHGTYLAQPFDETKTWSEAFDEYRSQSIGNMTIQRVPFGLEERFTLVFSDAELIYALTHPLTHMFRVLSRLDSLHERAQHRTGHLQAKSDIDHALIRANELLNRFRTMLVRYARSEVGPHADASDGLRKAYEIYFVPQLIRFFEALGMETLNGVTVHPFLDELREFNATTMMLNEDIQLWVWLHPIMPPF